LGFTELLGKNIQNDLDVAVRIEMAAELVGKDFFQFRIIDDISVVGHHYSEWRADEKRLSVFSAAAPDGGITGVADADVPLEALDVFDGKNIPDEPVSFFSVEAAVIGRDPGSILPPVLDG